MPDFPERYEPTGEEGLRDHLSSLHQPHQSPQPQPPQSQHGSWEHDRYSSKSKEIERDKERSRDREWGQDRDKDCDHHQTYHRDQQWERNERNEKGYDDDYHQSRDFDRQMDHDREEEDKHGHWFRCHSNVRSSHRSRSHSRPKRKRISGFDLPPPVSAAGTGQIPGTAPAISGQPSGTLPIVPVQPMTQQAARHARRVYVGGLSPSANEQSVASFFSQVMTAIGGNTAGRGDAVVNVYINHDKKFAFVEMRSVEEASNAMALDGIIFEGLPVKVRRPSDYNPSLAATLGPSEPHPHLNLAAVGLIPGSDAGLEGPDRIFVGGLPYYFSEAQIGELLESFGPLRGFDLVKDRETGNSKGYAFCVYQDLSVTDNACAALNGIKMGDRTLTVRRANQIACQPKLGPEDVLSHALQHIALQRLSLQPRAAVRSPTKVVSLTQLITSDELKDDEEYEDIMEDMRQEAGNFGNLVNIVIPRPRPHAEPSTGVGTVFLEYADVEAATKARAGMHGRKFDGNQVVAMFYPENKFAQGKYHD